MHDIRIAGVIFNSPAGGINDNLDRMRAWVAAAAKKQAAIVCFPEMNISGYSLRENEKQADQTISGPVGKSLGDMAADANITILAGLAETGPKDRTFASHLVVPPDGNIGVYRKLHIAPPEKKIFSAGNDVPLFKAAGLTFGIQLCYDAHFPELSTRMAISGADLLFFPHASPRGTPPEKFRSWMRHLPARAFDNGVFVIAVNPVGKNQQGLSFPGIAVAIDPSGELIKKKIKRQRKSDGRGSRGGSTKARA